jgi:oligosaccharide repeat unit polymerase
MTLLASILIAGLAVLNWSYAKSILFPPVVFCLVWASILMGLVLSGNTFYPLSAITPIVCVLGCVAFSAGAMAFHPLRGLGKFRRWQARTLREDKWTLRAIDVLFVIFAGLYPVYWMRLAEMGHGSVGLALLQQVRLEMIEGDLGNSAGLGPFRYVLAALIVITLIVTTETCRMHLSKWRLFLWILLAMAYNIPTGSRLSSLVVLFGVLAIFAFAKNSIPLLPAISIGMAVVIVFAVVAIAMGKGGSLTQSPLENASGVVRSLQVYVFGGIVACDQSLQKPPERPQEMPSFRFFDEVAVALGSHTSAPPLLLPYVNTPSETNAYSVFYSYFGDFGWAGMSAIFMGLGMGFAGLYRAAAMGRPEAVTLLGLGCAYLVLTCSGDPFLSGLSACIQSATLVWLIYDIVPLLRWCNVAFSPSQKLSKG